MMVTYNNVFLKGLVFLLFIIINAGGLANDNKDERWSLIDVGKIDNLAIRIKVKNRACLADEEWLGIQFDNHSSETLHIRDINFTFNNDNLASGNTYDLFPEAWRSSGPVGPRCLAPGITEKMQHMSDYSNALLGLPPRKSIMKTSHIYLTLFLEDGTIFQTSGTGVPFNFEWYYPDSGQMEQIRQRSYTMLEHPDQRFAPTVLFLTLLKLDLISLEEIIEALPKHRTQNPRSGSYYSIIEYLGKEKNSEPAVIEYIRNTLTHRNTEGLELLNAWNEAYTQPLLEWIETPACPQLERILLYFDYNYSEWQQNPGIAERIIEIVKQNIPLLTNPSDQIKDTEIGAWKNQASYAGIARSCEMISLLVPFLDDKRALFETKFLANRFYSEECDIYPRDRVCDVAYYTILKIKSIDKPQYGDKFRPLPEELKINASAGNFEERYRHESETVHAYRNRVIALLKKDLDE